MDMHIVIAFLFVMHTITLIAGTYLGMHHGVMLMKPFYVAWATMFWFGF
jgi:hypothetical protein